MNNNKTKKDESGERTPLEAKVDTILLLLITMFIILIVILGTVSYGYIILTSSESSGYIINGKPFY